jgi:hypothetical protein
MESPAASGVFYCLLKKNRAGACCFIKIISFSGALFFVQCVQQVKEWFCKLFIL